MPVFKTKPVDAGGGVYKIKPTLNGEGSGGTKVVTELPDVGEEHVVYELRQEVPADFPWLLTELTEYYPTLKNPFIVVETEDQVTQEYLAMCNDRPIAVVFVKNTNNVYDCYIDDKEDTFVKEIILPGVDNTYLIAKQRFAILKDFDYLRDTTGEAPILNGTGHFLDDTEFNYEDRSGVVPLVLTDATNKKLLLNGNNLVGVIELTELEPTDTIVNKIDLSLEPKVNNVFVPQLAHTVTSYWIYSNNTWTNVDDVGKLDTITIPIKSIDGNAGLILLSKIHFYLNDKELELVTVQSEEPEIEDCGYLVAPLLDSVEDSYQLHIVFDNDVVIGSDCALTNHPVFVSLEDDPYIILSSDTKEYDFAIVTGSLILFNGSNK